MIPARAPGPALVALAIVGVSAGAATSAAFVPPAPGRHEVRIPIQPPQTTYPLGRSFVLAGSDSASVRDRRLEIGRAHV